MMKITRTIFLSLALAILIPMVADAQEEGYAFRLSNFKLEFYDGYAKLAPADFNTIADYEESYLQFYYVQRYAALGADYDVTTERIGDDRFRRLTSGVPVGGRIRYEVSPTLSLSIGLQYFSGKRDSQVGMTVTVLEGGSNSLTDRYENNGFGLSVKAWSPQVGAHFGWDLFRIFRPEVFIVFGPMFVECRAVSDRHTTTIEPNGYRSELFETDEMKGKKSGLSGELGGALRFHAAKFLEFFAEVSYIFRTVDEVSGPGSSRTVISNSNSGETSTSSTWEKIWRVFPFTAQTSWGRFTEKTASNAYDICAGVMKFGLDLSGFQLKAGLGIRL
jgi:hypothetical protein